MRQRWHVLGAIQIVLSLVGLAFYFFDFHEYVAGWDDTEWMRDSGFHHGGWTVVIAVLVSCLCVFWSRAKPRRIMPSIVGLISAFMSVAFLLSATVFPHFLSRERSLLPEAMCWLALVAAFGLSIATLVGASRRRHQLLH